MEAQSPRGLEWVRRVLTQAEELGRLWIRPGFCGGHNSYGGFSSPMKFIGYPFPSQEEIFFFIEDLVEGFNVPLDIIINTSQRFLRRMIHIFVQKCFDCIFFNTE